MFKAKDWRACGALRAGQAYESQLQPCTSGTRAASQADFCNGLQCSYAYPRCSWACQTIHEASSSFATGRWHLYSWTTFYVFVFVVYFTLATKITIFNWIKRELYCNWMLKCVNYYFNKGVTSWTELFSTYFFISWINVLTSYIIPN